MATHRNGTRVSRQARKCAALGEILVKEEVKIRFKKVEAVWKKGVDERTDSERDLLKHSADVTTVLEKRARIRDKKQNRDLEFEDPPDVLESKCALLADAISTAHYVVVYTGAGISTAASIPDYRGPNGVWTLLKKGKSILPQDLSDAEPTRTHMGLVELYRNSLIDYVVSQNCDGLHLRSGLPRSCISEVHGNMFIEVCNSCNPVREYLRAFDVTEKTAHRHRTARQCKKCRAALKDTIIHFGEKGPLRGPPYNWNKARSAADKADVILCLGSSLKVLRKYQSLWAMSRPKQERPNVYIVNLQWTPKDDIAALKINGRCDEVMTLVLKRLGLHAPIYDRAYDPLFHLHTPLTKKEVKSTKKKVLPIPENLVSLQRVTRKRKRYMREHFPAETKVTKTDFLDDKDRSDCKSVDNGNVLVPSLGDHTYAHRFVIHRDHASSGDHAPSGGDHAHTLTEAIFDEKTSPFFWQTNHKCEAGLSTGGLSSANVVTSQLAQRNGANLLSSNNTSRVENSDHRGETFGGDQPDDVSVPSDHRRTTELEPSEDHVIGCGVISHSTSHFTHENPFIRSLHQVDQRSPTSIEHSGHSGQSGQSGQSGHSGHSVHIATAQLPSVYSVMNVGGPTGDGVSDGASYVGGVSDGASYVGGPFGDGVRDGAPYVGEPTGDGVRAGAPYVGEPTGDGVRAGAPYVGGHTGDGVSDGAPYVVGPIGDGVRAGAPSLAAPSITWCGAPTISSPWLGYSPSLPINPLCQAAAAAPSNGYLQQYFNVDSSAVMTSLPFLMTGSPLHNSGTVIGGAGYIPALQHSPLVWAQAPIGAPVMLFSNYLMQPPRGGAFQAAPMPYCANLNGAIPSISLPSPMAAAVSIPVLSHVTSLESTLATSARSTSHVTSLESTLATSTRSTQTLCPMDNIGADEVGEEFGELSYAGSYRREAGDDSSLVSDGTTCATFTAQSSSSEQTVPYHGQNQLVPCHGQNQTVPCHGQNQTVPCHGQNQTVPCHGQNQTVPCHGQTLTVNPPTADVAPSAGADCDNYDLSSESASQSYTSNSPDLRQSTDSPLGSLPGWFGKGLRVRKKRY